MFDKTKLQAELNSLPKNHCIAFAASCCERLVPNYQAFCLMEKQKESHLLTQALNVIWDQIGGKQIPNEDIHNLMQECEALAPDTEDYTSLFVSAAGDAVAAVVYTLESYLDEDISKIAIVGSLPVETIYSYLVRVNDPDLLAYVADPIFEEQMLNAPLMIAEIKKQQDDLNLLKSSPVLNNNLLRDLRQSSKTIGIRPFERGLVVPQQNVH